MCVSTMAQPDFPNGKFRFFPRWSLWSGAGGGYPPPPPTVYGHSETCPAIRGMGARGVCNEVEHVGTGEPPMLEYRVSVLCCLLMWAWGSVHALGREGSPFPGELLLAARARRAGGPEPQGAQRVIKGHGTQNVSCWQEYRGPFPCLRRNDRFPRTHSQAQTRPLSQGNRPHPPPLPPDENGACRCAGCVHRLPCVPHPSLLPRTFDGRMQ